MTADRPTDRVGERLADLRARVAGLEASKQVADEAQVEVLFRDDAKPSDLERARKKSSDLGRDLAEAREQLARVEELNGVAIRTAARQELAELALVRAQIAREWLPLVKKLRTVVADLSPLTAQIAQLKYADQLHAQSQRRAMDLAQIAEHTAPALPYASVLEPADLDHKVRELDTLLASIR